MRKSLLAVLLALAVTACAGASQTDAPAALDLEDESQRASYAQGFQIGQQGQGLPIEVDAFVAGVRDGIADDGELDEDAMQAALADFNRLMVESHNAEAEANLAAGEAWLAENAERPEVTVLESGVQYEVITEGDGPRPTRDDTVRVHYVGTLTDGTEFDSSRGGDGEPATFVLGQLIPGFVEGVELMPVGSTYRIYIPGPLGYGPNPRPGGVIKPNDALIFEIELLEIVEG